jgi:carbamoyl-phosphate synthase large subunit
VVEIAQALADLGFHLVATRGSAMALHAAGLSVTPVNKVTEGRPHIVDMIKNGEITFIVNVVEDKRAMQDSYAIRRNALQQKVTYYTTLAGAKAACIGMAHLQGLEVQPLQDLHRQLPK